MTIEAIGAAVTIAAGATVNIRPPLGEVWAISRVWGHSNTYVYLSVTNGSLSQGISDPQPRDEPRPVIITNAFWAKAQNTHGANGYQLTYEGVKL